MPMFMFFGETTCSEGVLFESHRSSEDASRGGRVVLKGRYQDPVPVMRGLFVFVSVYSRGELPRDNHTEYRKKHTLPIAAHGIVTTIGVCVSSNVMIYLGLILHKVKIYYITCGLSF
jgi:hypothetical protein